MVKKKERAVVPWTVEELYNERYYINLDAEYQREKIWNVLDKQRLINSIVKDIDIPKIYFAKIGNQYDCVDGKQRISSIIEFFDNNLKVWLGEEKDRKNEKMFTANELKKADETLFNKIKNYELTISFLPNTNPDYISETFTRLQLGWTLNTGERLHAMRGNMRDFVFKVIGKNGRFIKKSSLLSRRFSREYAIAQISINSFTLNKTGKFSRARREDIETFFENNRDIDFKSKELKRIQDTLQLCEEAFGKNAIKLESKGALVSAYLFIEKLSDKKMVNKFVEFYLKLVQRISEEQKLLRETYTVNNKEILEEFQKYILAASVEKYSVERRHNFLEKAFEYYNNNKKIIGD